VDAKIRPAHGSDIELLVQRALLAFEPIFDAFAHILGAGICQLIWPDWRSSQRLAIEMMCLDADAVTVLVAEANGRPVGRVAYQQGPAQLVGDVQRLAVRPPHQRRGIGNAMNAVALQEIRPRCMQLAKVETEGDTPHAPARASYGKAGYTALHPV
jgi:GNAT superfamily N-acetyltransferase